MRTRFRPTSRIPSIRASTARPVFARHRCWSCRFSTPSTACCSSSMPRTNPGRSCPFRVTRRSPFASSSPTNQNRRPRGNDSGMSTTSTRRRERSQSSERSAYVAAAAKPGTRILVVDDEPELLDMLTAYFLTSKYEVDTATNGFDALAVVAKQSPDVVLLDIHMPRMNGIETLKEIMKIDQSIAVIMVTGNNMKIDQSIAVIMVTGNNQLAITVDA